MKKTFNEILLNYNGNDRSNICITNMFAQMSSLVFGLAL